MLEIAPHAFPSKDKCYVSKDIYHVAVCLYVCVCACVDFAMAIISTTCRFLYTNWINLWCLHAWSRHYPYVYLSLRSKKDKLLTIDHVRAASILSNPIININYFYYYVCRSLRYRWNVRLCFRLILCWVRNMFWTVPPIISLKSIPDNNHLLLLFLLTRLFNIHLYIEWFTAHIVNTTKGHR